MATKYYKNQKELNKENIKQYYNLTKKIIKTGILNKKQTAHLAVMFVDAALSCDKTNQEIDGMFDKLLGM